MKQSILKKIIHDKIQWLQYQKKKYPLKYIYTNIVSSNRHFYQTLQSTYPSFILEIKQASPSKGIINPNINIQKISKYYKRHATVISVVTDEKYFCGNFRRLSEIKKLVKQPILCKDFFIDPYQIYLAKYYQADAILLMLSVLSDTQYKLLENIAHKMNMGILTEINNQDELKRAINLKAKIIGINNRNLHTLHVDLEKTYELAPLIPNDRIIISESGIQNNQQVKKLKKIVHGFLIGSSIMKSKSIDLKINSIIFGNNKVCGLTTPQSAIQAKKYGAVYGGLIFISTSPRNLKYQIANNIVQSTQLKYVGVFQDADIEKILFLSKKLKLHAIQLHGSENEEYILDLIKKIPRNIKIWKAICIVNDTKKLNFQYIDYYLFDNSRGGSGICFDWGKTKQYQLNKVFLSGGLSYKNCFQASKLNFFGLDFNSKLETSVGIKDKKKINILFKKLKLS